MLKLSQLDPELNESGILTFLCPACTRGLETSVRPLQSFEGDGHRIRVPISPAPPNSNGAAWDSTGNFPDTFALYPSINAGCWHGWVKNGEVTTC